MRENESFNTVCELLRGDWEHPKLPIQLELATIEPLVAPERMKLQNELLRTEVSVGQTTARVLIDAGATHNIVTVSFCIAANISLDHRTRTKQTVRTLTDGGTTTDVYPDVQVTITLHGWRHTIQCVAMDTDSRYDIVLGRPWHFHHNPTIDFTTNDVTITHKNKRTTTFRAIEKFAEDRTAYGLNTITMSTARRLQRKHQAEIYWVNIADTKSSQNKLGVSFGIDDIDIRNIAARYADVTPEDLPPGLPSKRHEQHEINLMPDKPLPRPRSMRLSHEMTVELRKQVERLLKLGWIRPSKSPVGAGAFFSRKPDGTWRFICDWRALNDITIKDSTTMPNIEDSLNELREARYFSKLDLHSGFYQVRIRDEDCWKSAIRTSLGTFEWLVMPMGLSNSPATFQRLMNGVMRNCVGKYVVVYLDDILIYSKTLAEHKTHLASVLQTLRDAKLYCKPKKCLFAATRMSFLGHVVENGTIVADPEKTKAVSEMKPPQNVHEVRRFVGFANYFRRYLQGFSTMALPLHKLTHKHASFVWGRPEQQAWERIRDALISTPVLQLPDWNKPFIVQTDASDVAIGGVLMQQQGDDRVVIAYRTRVLTKTQGGWPAHEREL